MLTSSVKTKNSLSIFPSKDHSIFLLRISFVNFLSSVYAVYQKHYILALLPAEIFLTSINYWCHPDYSWRRYVDILFVNFAIVYQTSYAFLHNAEHSAAITTWGALYPALFGNNITNILSSIFFDLYNLFTTKHSYGLISCNII